MKYYLVLVLLPSAKEGDKNDKVQSKSASALYDEGWERTFGSKTQNNYKAN